MALRAARGWYGRNENDATAESDAGEELTVTAKPQLLAKMYEIDVLKCPKCGGRMSVAAVIRDPDEIRKIIKCLETKGRGPP
jgi:hypothetical protein